MNKIVEKIFSCIRRFKWNILGRCPYCGGHFINTNDERFEYWKIQVKKCEKCKYTYFKDTEAYE